MAGDRVRRAHRAAAQVVYRWYKSEHKGGAKRVEGRGGEGLGGNKGA